MQQHASTRRRFLSQLGLGAATVALGCATTRQPLRAKRRPNIVVLLADDLGYADLGIHGSTDIATPHIDRIARNGVRFSAAYVSYPACGPSRAALLTGRHNARFGFRTNPDRVKPTREGNPLGLPLEEETLAEALKKQGYTTGCFGKWHLGHTWDLHPQEQGFDEFYGFLGSLYRYFDLGNLRPPECIMRGKERVHEPEYLTYALGRESVDFIERHQDNPFFLYLSFNAVHTPLMDDNRPPDHANITLNGSDDPAENRRVYENMVRSLDETVGQVMNKLDQLGLTDDTLVFFVGDNGGARETGAFDNMPLRDYKGTLYEGGIRVPFMMQWPGHVPQGAVYPEPVSAMDIFTTSLAAAKARPAQDRTIDGINLLPYVQGHQQGVPHDALFWERENQYAVRVNGWKLIERSDRPPELYHIARDIGENTDLARRYPDRVKDLQDRLENWRAQLPEPLFVPDLDQWEQYRKSNAG